MPLMSDSDKRVYLAKRDWKTRAVPHAWKWYLPPLEACYQLGDAFDLQISIEGEKFKAKKRKKGTAKQD